MAAATLREAATLTDAADAEGVSRVAGRRVSVERLLRQRREVDGARRDASSRRSVRTRCTRTSGSTTRRPSRPSSRCKDEPSRPSCRSSPALCRTSRTTCPSIRRCAIRGSGALAPIAVVNTVFSAGDANRGVQTAAFNLPNDERVIREKGSKRVMLKNSPGGQVRQGAACRFRRSRWRAADQGEGVVRRVLHAHPDARADARARARTTSPSAAARRRSARS